MTERCPWCGGPLAIVWVHGQGVCQVCRSNLESCCGGNVGNCDLDDATPSTEEPEPRAPPKD